MDWLLFIATLLCLLNHFPTIRWWSSLPTPLCRVTQASLCIQRAARCGGYAVNTSRGTGEVETQTPVWQIAALSSKEEMMRQNETTLKHNRRSSQIPRSFYRGWKHDSSKLNMYVSVGKCAQREKTGMTLCYINSLQKQTILSVSYETIIKYQTLFWVCVCVCVSVPHKSLVFLFQVFSALTDFCSALQLTRMHTHTLDGNGSIF